MMVFVSIYGVVDGFFISNFAGKTPFAAVNLIWPFLMIMSTVGFMFGTGGSALVSRTFGMGENDKANRYFSLFVYFSFGVGVALAILGIIFIRPISAMLGAEGNMLENAVVYGRVILIALPFNILQFLFQSFFVTSEKPKLGLVVTLSSGITNMVLDAALVISLPQEHKLMGAAIATAISQILGAVIALFYFFSKNTSILRLDKTRFEGKIILKAAVNGSSEFMSNIAMSLVGVLYNLQLLRYAGENGVAAYGVMMYVSMIFSSVFFGYSIGIAPVVGFHFGAENSAELKNLLRKSCVIIGCFGVFMIFFSQIIALPLSKIFVGYDT
jgi:putative MATE family efflux protein